MSVDEPLYCGDCGLSHEGEHGPEEFCEFHRNVLMVFAEDSGECACRLCDPQAVRDILEAA